MQFILVSVVWHKGCLFDFPLYLEVHAEVKFGKPCFRTMRQHSVWCCQLPFNLQHTMKLLTSHVMHFKCHLNPYNCGPVFSSLTTQALTLFNVTKILPSLHKTRKQAINAQMSHSSLQYIVSNKTCQTLAK